MILTAHVSIKTSGESEELSSEVNLVVIQIRISTVGNSSFETRCSNSETLFGEDTIQKLGLKYRVYMYEQ